MNYFNPRKITVEYKNGHIRTYYEAEVFSEETERKLNFYRLARKYKKNALKYYRDIRTVWVTVSREIYNHHERHIQRDNQTRVGSRISQ